MTLSFSDLNFNVSTGISGGGEDANFLPAGTVINVKADGTGDFATLKDAVDSLQGKWSNGVIKIQLDSGVHILNDTIAFNGSENGIPLLIISGNGAENTILQSGLTGTGYLLRVRFNANVHMEDLKVAHPSGTSSTDYRGFEIGECARLSLYRTITFDGISRCCHNYANGVVIIAGTVNVLNSKIAFNVSGGILTSASNQILNLTNVGTAFNISNGGQMHGYGLNVNKTNVTKVSNMSVNTATNDGWITGVTL